MKHSKTLLFRCLLLSLIFLSRLTAEEIRIRENSFQSDCPIIRAQRPFRFTTVVENDGCDDYRCRLILPDDGSTQKNAKTEKTQDGFLRHDWDVLCAVPGQKDFTLELLVGDKVVRRQTISQVVLPPRKIEKLDYIPEPKSVQTPWLIGAHHCPLWEKDAAHLWDQVVRKHQERTPALGIYVQDNPEIADWETKWAVEHGISFFIYCWYRVSQGGPVEARREKSTFDDALFRSKFGDKMKFTIMWENQRKGFSGVADEKDLTENLLPHWIEKFFKRDNYLKIDNKPVLFVYRPLFVSDDLGGDDKARAAYDLMREACKKAGFDGLYILGEYRGTDPRVLQRFKDVGLDYTFAYCWHVQNSPPPEVVIETQLENIRKTQEMNAVLPQVATFSQAWSGWRDEGSIWKLPPADFETLLRRGKDFIEKKISKDELGSKMVILDNWNEWSEGHYIAPYREYGFGYLDAVRRVFTDAPEEHDDLIPSDIGLGPYDLPKSRFEPQASWDFNDVWPAWQGMMGVKNLRREGGTLRFDTTTRDPAIWTDPARLPVKSFDKVVLRMKTSVSKPDRLQFFWKTETMKDYEEKCGISATVSPGPDFKDYALDLSTSDGWTGRAIALRLDPVANPDVQVEIDFIRLEGPAGR